MRRRRAVLVATVLVVAVGAVFAAQTPGRLSSSGYEPTDAESTRAAADLRRVFPANTVDLAIVVTAREGTIDSPAVEAAGRDLTERIAAEPGVARASSYWTLAHLPSLRGRDDRYALLVVALDSELQPRNEATAKRIVERYGGEQGPLEVAIGGPVESIRELASYSKDDATTAELFVMPVALIVLIVMFGSVVASLLPFITAGIATVGTLASLYVLSRFTDASIFGMNIATILALGLAADYSLLAVSRFREELDATGDAHLAAARTVRTAGRTIFFSGLTVTVSFSALFAMPTPMFGSIGLAGMACAGSAVFGAVVVLPAVLALLGERVNAVPLWQHSLRPPEHGFWYRSARRVMRHPVVVIVAVGAVLLTLGSPFLRMRAGVSDDRQLPPSAPARQAQDLIRAHFDGDEARALSVVATGTGPAASRSAEVERYATEVSTFAGVANVQTLTGTYVRGAKAHGPDLASLRYGAPDGVWFRVVPDVEPVSERGAALVEEIRRRPAPFPVEVTGFGARFVDIRDAFSSAFPLVAVLLAASMFVLLFLMSGSVLVPLKAIVLNILSLTASFGAMVWVFQDGHLSGLLDFTPLDTIELNIPVFMLAVSFGLSMDYEVFLLSRIKEEYDRTGDNEESVAVGLQHTGRVVTACAVLMAVVLLGLVGTRVTSSKVFGLSVALAVLVDAFVIRGTLVPAVMKLAGPYNWWAPRWMQAIHRRIGIRESAAGEQGELAGLGDEVAGAVPDLAVDLEEPGHDEAGREPAGQPPGSRPGP